MPKGWPYGGVDCMALPVTWCKGLLRRVTLTRPFVFLRRDKDFYSVRKQPSEGRFVDSSHKNGHFDCLAPVRRARASRPRLVVLLTTNYLTPKDLRLSVSEQLTKREGSLPLEKTVISIKIGLLENMNRNLFTTGG